jgi:D-alanyl-D-alanine carboxypeptidase/D-alanyl-D-alanine-endopeptidase (penicillin-binding protein 4)
MRSGPVSNSRRLLFLLLSMLSLMPSVAQAQDALPAEVSAALKTAGIPANAAGIFVQEVGARRPTLAANAARPLNPASTMKLVTTFAALDLLGPNFTWKTQVLADGAITGDTLEGDLILKGGGDPKLTLENLWLVARALRMRGLRHIRGDLVLDRMYFEPGDHDPGQFDAEPLRPYNVGPDALLVNFKAIRFSFVPDSVTGQVQILADPRPQQLELAQAVRGVDGPCGDWRSRLKADFQNGATQARVAFSGLYPIDCGEKAWNIALLSHPNYIYGVFRQIWEESGGSLGGNWRNGATPPTAKLLYVHESPSLSEIARDINKYSNNVMARQLFLTLSAEALKTPGRNSHSAQLIRSWLTQRAIHVPELVMDNGSGLSRIERISAANLAHVLDTAYRSAVMPELMASLPLVAQDGTMKRRLNGGPVAGQAHIKTGSLADVRAIAGYVLDRRGRRHVVVFIINHANAAAGQGAQDALLRWVYAGDAAGRCQGC